MKKEDKQSDVIQTTLHGRNGYSETINTSCVIWTATIQVRWKKTGKITFGVPDTELQQMWRSDTGEEKWKRIEIVE